jgi:hypothetical protein
MTLRPALLAAAALAAAFWISLALYRWGAGGNRELWGVVEEIGPDEQLKPYIEGVRRRHEAKQALAAEVLDRKRTWREAAGLFRRLDEAAPAFPPGNSRLLGGEWFYGESVLDYVWEVLVAQGRYAAGARSYAEAFTAEPQFLATPPVRHRYRGACAAARAGCGRGRDAADLDETSRAGFRRLAHDWLRAGLEARLRLLERGPQAARNTVTHDLQRWLWDPHFAGVRGPKALGRLPEPERQAWQKLWAEVEDTLSRAEGRIPPPPKAGGKIPLPER